MTLSEPINPLLETSISQITTVKFSDLLPDADLVSALTSLGLVSATPVQAGAIPEALAGHDLVVQASTGSGKTLAFVLPIIERVRKVSSKVTTLALVVTPTRELALQVRNVISSVAPDLNPACIIGGNKQEGQIRELRLDARIVIGTPGRLLDLLQQRAIVLRKCTTYVLDEADEMLSMGFVEEIRAIVGRLPKLRQGMFFSATITPRVDNLARSFLSNPKTIVIQSVTSGAPEIKHLYCKVDGSMTSKASMLCSLLEKEAPQSAIVFCNTKSDTELVEVFLRRRGFDARRINSDLTQKQREEIMNDFRSGELKLLIATDVAARGIDIENLDLVVNYSLHELPETYVHRTGRTGRAGRSGRAISIVGPFDFGAFYGLTRKLSIKLEELPALGI